ncbi:hypothetical protein FVEG_14695 [Fusarium verticillioides 7600]|uniref:Uncharacterized protein n=1 Tax=Gibberella moniliformis (strain M3125 / FGSC 7600) TaxID=334819 RepID=W7LMP4_GIBM7|nr:hypothetical protein FVEG_14695 [Fusarium verticillioides 7600]EWG36684.1 hypothetical protein FVEG_14695 [Fusarium verticillioides 7600]
MPLLKCSRNSCEQSLYIKQLKRILLYSTGPACMRFSSSIGDCFLPGLTAKRCRYRNLGNLLICGVFCLSMLQLAQLKLGRANNSIGRSVCLPECDSDTDAPGPSLLTVCVALVDSHCCSLT